MDRPASLGKADVGALTERRVNTSRGPITFVTLGKKSAHRARQLTEKEPHTLAWVESLPDRAVLWDVGANTGTFSLAAALNPGVQVRAFEPGAVNYFLLEASIEANGWGDRVRSFCVALGGETAIRSLAVSQFAPAASFHFEKPGAGGHFGHRTAVLTFSIDDFRRVFNEPCPSHLKIDVPIGTAAVLAGADQTLGDKALREIWIELNRDAAEYSEICRLLRDAGFACAATFEKKQAHLVDSHFHRV